MSHDESRYVFEKTTLCIYIPHLSAKQPFVGCMLLLFINIYLSFSRQTYYEEKFLYFAHVALDSLFSSSICADQSSQKIVDSLVT